MVVRWGLLVNRVLVNVPTYSVSRVRLGARVCTKRFLYKAVGIHKLFTTELRGRRTSVLTYNALFVAYSTNTYSE